MRRIHVPAIVTNRYRLFSPTGRYKIFRVFRLDGSKWKTVKTPEIATINTLFLNKKISQPQAKEQLGLVIEALYKADGVKVSRVESNKHNEKIIDEYIADKVSKKKRLSPSSKIAAENYIRSALRAIGEHSISTADLATLQEAFDKAYPDHRQRRLVTAINSVLAWLKRDIRLEMHTYVPPDVKYISITQLQSILPHLPNEAWRVCAQMAFYTGLRIGELFALERQNKKEFTISVDWQLLRSGQKALPKNGKRRTVVPFSEAFELFDKWTMFKHEVTPEERAQASKVIQRACRRAFPKRREFHIRFHDLRHSYAVRALEQGMSIEMIAKQLGNAIEVCEKHYIGFVQSTYMSEAAFNILNGKNERKKIG